MNSQYAETQTWMVLINGWMPILKLQDFEVGLRISHFIRDSVMGTAALGATYNITFPHLENPRICDLPGFASTSHDGGTTITTLIFQF